MVSVSVWFRIRVDILRLRPLLFILRKININFKINNATHQTKYETILNR